MGRKRKRKTFECQRCGVGFVATVCVSGLCKECRKNKHGESPKCACGCGESVSWQYGKEGGWRRYLQGHHLRDIQQVNPGMKKGDTPWNKGNVAYTFTCAYEGCQKQFSHSDRSRKYCSRKCSGLAARGREPWHKGKTNRDDPRLIVLGQAVSRTRQIKPTHNKGKNKQIYAPLARAGRSISAVLKAAYAEGRLVPTNLGATRDDPRWAAICEKISETKAAQIARGENTPRWYKYARVGWMLNCLTGEQELFRSSYEAAYMDRLNSEGVWWTTKHGLLVRWVDNEGFYHRYVPDFQVWVSDKVWEVHEIKNAYMEKDEANQRKFQAAIRKGWREGWGFKVLTEHTNPEFVGFDPVGSSWFCGYDKKTKHLLDESLM